MWTKKERPSKLLWILAEYLGFATLCGFVNILFFKWAAKVIIGNYELQSENAVTIETEYWISKVILVAGILIAIFVLTLLLQQKFSYMLEISRAVEKMEAGNLKIRIPIVGEDELGDLAARINYLAETMEEQMRISEQARRERFDVVASLSHDIRTPLTAVMSYMQFIRDGQYKNSEQLSAYADKAYEKAYRIKEMTDSLFENCVKDIEEVTPLEKIDGNRFVKQVLFDIEDFLEESGFIVEIEPFKESQPFFLEVNREKIARVFDNLISNIEKYAKKSQPIKIQVRIEAPHFIFVQENAVVDKQQKENVESHLIGLKGVQKIVHELGGTVLIKEESDTFQIEINLPIM